MTIVTRVMLGTVLTTAAELALPPRRCGLSGCVYRKLDSAISVMKSTEDRP
jgi:hypothetical protein